MPVADAHVHSQWSWDAELGSMERTCERAIQIGLPAIAFTDHADFTPWERSEEGRRTNRKRLVGPHLSDGRLDTAGYWECLDRCRGRFPGLRILSGVELGEPHIFADECRAILEVRPLDRVIGALHCVREGDDLIDMSTAGFADVATAAARTRSYFEELLPLAEQPELFPILGHVTYPQRYWPKGTVFDELRYEEEIRAVFRAAARSELVLEINSTRGMAPERGLCPGPRVTRWWYEAGGGAVCFGSDAHDPTKIAEGFAFAEEMAEAAGFRPARDPAEYWRR